MTTTTEPDGPLRLFDDSELTPTIATPRYRADQTLVERFAAFDMANPWVADRLEQMTDDLIARGHTRVGIGMLFEVLRWQSMRATSDPGSGFRLNNSYRSRYARLLIGRRPEWADVFEVRRMPSEES